MRATPSTPLDIRALAQRHFCRWTAGAKSLATALRRFRLVGGGGVLLVAVLFAGPVVARQELAAIKGWRIENATSVPTAKDSVLRGKAPPRQLRVLLNRQYPVLDRGTWIDVDGHRLGPARYSEDLRSLSVLLPPSIRIGPKSRIAIADPYAMARPPRSSDGHVRQALPWKPPAMEVIKDDPTSPGPYEVEPVDYTLGDQAFEFDFLPSEKRRGEITARIYLPKDLKGPRPVVLLLHGLFPTCYVEGGEVSFAWPCSAPARPIDSYLGYAAIGNALASHGYVVVSVSANGINANDLELGRWARAKLLRAHLDYLALANASGTPELGNQLVGKLDLEKIGVIGHSRGGEGAVQAAIDGNNGVGRFKFSAVFALAPTVLQADARVPGPALAVMLPYCDGDVADLEGQRYIDESRHAYADNVPRTALIAHGANHNFFNTRWTTGSPGGWDDGPRRGGQDGICLPGTYYRVSAQEQVRAGAAYIAAFFRLQLGAEQQFAALFDGSATRAPGKVIVQSVATAPAPQRLDLATFEQSSAAVSHQGWQAAVYCAGANGPESPEKPYCAVRWPGYLPHWGSHGKGDMLRLGWTDRNAKTRVQLPGTAADVSGYAMLSLRAMPSYDRHNRSAAPDLAITLVDQRGNRATVLVSQVSDALASLPSLFYFEANWILRGVQIPLKSFQGVDLTAITSVELAPATDEGEVFLSDLAFTK